MNIETHPYQKIDYNYLRPSYKAIQSKKAQNELFYHDPKTNKSLYRNIFYGINISQHETKEIQKFEKILKQEKIPLPEYWTINDSFRFQEAGSYNFQGAKNDIIEHNKWINSMKNFNLTKEAAQIQNSGYLGIYGIDQNGCPNIVLRFNKLKTDAEGTKALENGLNFVMCVTKKYYMLPYYQEKYNQMIDVGNASVISQPKTQIMSTMNLVEQNFKNHINKIIIYNLSTTGYVLFKLLKNLFNRHEKLMVIKKGNEKEFLGVMNPRKWPKKWGGDMSMSSFKNKDGNYWPPNMLDVDIVTMKDIQLRDQMVFDILSDEIDVRVLFRNMRSYKDDKEDIMKKIKDNWELKGYAINLLNKNQIGKSRKNEFRFEGIEYLGVFVG